MLILRAQNLGSVAHGFFGRTGGVSTGVYASLNCGPGSGDASEAIAENRRRATAALAPDAQLVTLAQCHSAEVRVADEAWDMTARPSGDALVTARPGIALGILTADCAPVLFFDPRARVIAAAHAGWKGALGGVIEATLAAMEKLGARRPHIRAAIGPCISRANYETGPEFRARFLADDPANERFFTGDADSGRRHFDLEAYVLHRLAQAGLEGPEALSACTYARQGDFFSFRRATHRGERDYGRQLSAIML